MTSKQFKVGDKVKRVEDFDENYPSTSGEVVTIACINDLGDLSFVEDKSTRSSCYYELVEAAEVPQGQEVTLSFKGDSLKVNLKATNPEGYYCNEDDLLLAMQKIMQIAKNWNTFSLTIKAEDKDSY